MNNDAAIARIVFLIIGCFTVFLGYITKRYKLADIIAGFNPNKYDRTKITDIVGGNLILMGLLIILLTIIYYLVPQLDFNLYSVLTPAIIVALVIKIIINTEKYARIK